ncbi:hypothetical protein ACIQXV_25520 [Neobacillus sp. NPDC097160]|uniref:hypothetical protein n=1 Tax=Neobacillus sp. NPDC097160 TaxID=3364298 RepID=UPI0037F954EB
MKKTGKNVLHRPYEDQNSKKIGKNGLHHPYEGQNSKKKAAEVAFIVVTKDRIPV